MNTKLILSLALILTGGPALTHVDAADTDSSAAKLVNEFKSSKVFWQQFETAKEIVSLRNTNVLSGLAAGLTNEDRHARGNVAFIFAALGDERGFDILQEILTDRSARPEGQGVNPNWTIQAQIASDRYYAAHLFGDLKDPRAVPILIPLLQDKEVRDIVPWSLGQIGDSRAIGPLMEELNEKDASMCVLAIDALGQLQATEALPRLRELTASKEESNFGELISVGEAANAAITKIMASKALNGKGPEWVASCLKDFAVIKLGMTRQEIERRFPKDGGIYSASKMRFHHPTCVYFKIDVEFSFKRDAADQNRAIMGADDPATQVSKPYIEWAYID